MGTWYVHGYTPTFLDKGARDATETYELRDDGRIATTYRFRTSPDGDFKTLHPVGKVVDEQSNAEWRMRFFWLFSAPYLILHVNDAHTETVIGHPNRKMMWIMTRSPEIEESDWERLVAVLRQRDYDLDKLSRLPHAPSTD